MIKAKVFHKAKSSALGFGTVIYWMTDDKVQKWYSLKPAAAQLCQFQLSWNMSHVSFAIISSTIYQSHISLLLGQRCIPRPHTKRFLEWRLWASSALCSVSIRIWKWDLFQLWLHVYAKYILLLYGRKTNLCFSECMTWQVQYWAQELEIATGFSHLGI